MSVWQRHDRNNAWWFKFQVAGKPHRNPCLDEDGKPCRNRTEAKAAERRARIAAEAEADAPAPVLGGVANYTLLEALDDLEPGWRRQADYINKARAIDELLHHFGQARRIADISQTDIRKYTDWAMARPIKFWKGGPTRDPAKPEHARYWVECAGRTRTAATQNHYFKVLRQALALAGGLRLPNGELAFTHLPKVEALRQLEHDPDPVPEKMIAKVHAMLPQHAKDAVELSVYFGFRRSEAFGLTIDKVDFQFGGVRLKAADSKSRKGEFQPGGPTAMALLERLVRQAKARGVKHLITYRKEAKDPSKSTGKYKAIKTVRSAWETVMEKIEAEHGQRWRWHDIRAAYVTFVVLAHGQQVAQTMARHASFATTQRYIKVADKLKRAAAESVDKSFADLLTPPPAGSSPASSPAAADPSERVNALEAELAAARAALAGSAGGVQSGHEEWAPGNVVPIRKALSY